MECAETLNRLIIVLHAFIFSKYILNSTLFQYLIKRYEALILITYCILNILKGIKISMMINESLVAMYSLKLSYFTTQCE